MKEQKQIGAGVDITMDKNYISKVTEKFEEVTKDLYPISVINESVEEAEEEFALIITEGLLEYGEDFYLNEAFFSKLFKGKDGLNKKAKDKSISPTSNKPKSLFSKIKDSSLFQNVKALVKKTGVPSKIQKVVATVRLGKDVYDAERNKHTQRTFVDKLLRKPQQPQISKKQAFKNTIEFMKQAKRHAPALKRYSGVSESMNSYVNAISKVVKNV